MPSKNLAPAVLFRQFDAFPKVARFDDFDFFSPSAQMPRHFQRAARAKFYDQRTVFVFNRFLIRMENEVFRLGRGFRAEFPFDVVRFFAVHAERIFHILILSLNPQLSSYIPVNPTISRLV